MCETWGVQMQRAQLWQCLAAAVSTQISERNEQFALPPVKKATINVFESGEEFLSRLKLLLVPGG